MEKVTLSIQRFLHQIFRTQLTITFIQELRKEAIKDKWSLPFINITKMEKAVANSTYFEGVTPRWLSIADFANSTNLNLTSPGILLIFDTLKEVQIGLGREFSKTVLKNREAFVTKSLLEYLNID